MKETRSDCSDQPGQPRALVLKPRFTKGNFDGYNTVSGDCYDNDGQHYFFVELAAYQKLQERIKALEQETVGLVSEREKMLCDATDLAISNNAETFALQAKLTAAEKVVEAARVMVTDPGPRHLDRIALLTKALVSYGEVK